MTYTSTSRGANRLRLPLTTGAAGGGGGGGGTNTIEVSAKDTGMTKNVAITDATYNRLYASIWVKRPPQNVNAVGCMTWKYRDSLTNLLQYTHASMSGSNTVYDIFPRIILPLTASETLSRDYDSGALSGNATNALWTHMLIEVDTTEAALADRLKLYLNDTKITTFSENSTASTQNKLLATGSSTPNYMEIAYTDWAGYGVNEGVSRIAGFWFKVATSNLFDFDSATDRRYFITAGLEYVTHQSVMGSQTADIWGAGTKAAWTAAGWTVAAGATDTSDATIVGTN